MSQINLMSGGGELKNSAPGSLLSKSLFLSGAVLVISFGAYYGAVYYRDSLQKSINAHEADRLAKRNLIEGEKADRVADFADRLAVINTNLEKTSMAPNDPFAKLERVILPEANLTSYEYDATSGTITAMIAADSFRAIAQQIVLFKKENLFSVVALDGDVRVGSSGKIEAKLILTL